MRRSVTLFALSVACLFALGGIAFADAEVTITDDGVKPESVKADVRETIVWTNASDADVSLVGTDPRWESGPIEPGATFSIEITRKGTYNYESEDGSISGEIVVGQAGGGGDDDDKAGDQQDNGDTKNKDKQRGGGDKPDERIDPNEEALPHTGIDATVPGALSLLLIGLGGGLLAVTPSPRRYRG